LIFKFVVVRIGKVIAVAKVVEEHNDSITNDSMTKRDGEV
jgi:hypothetical protein